MIFPSLVSFQAYIYHAKNFKTFHVNEPFVKRIETFVKNVETFEKNIKNLEK